MSIMGFNFLRVTFRFPSLSFVVFAKGSISAFNKAAGPPVR
jgi:hypothetical protein